MRINLLAIIVISLLFSIPACTSHGSSQEMSLEEGFANPPQEIKPLVWWHWMNGNITKDGALKDIEWMHRVGLGGFQVFDAAFATPQVVDKRLDYMTPEWDEVFTACIKKADSLGMEVAIASSPGWSETGGPWVKPEQAMKKIVWSEIDICGPYDDKLPDPPSNSSTFQNINANLFSEDDGSLNFYRDIAVIAMKMPEGYKPLSELEPEITSSGGNFDLSMLTDEDYVTSRILPFDDKGSDAWIQYEFTDAQTVYGVSLVGPNGSMFAFMSGANQEDNTVLEWSSDGQQFTRITSVNDNVNGVSSVTFEPVRAKYFRLTYKQQKKKTPSDNDLPEFLRIAPASRGVNVAEFKLFTLPRVERFLQKAAFANTNENLSNPVLLVQEGISSDYVIDISDKMDAEGHLNWNPGEGVWKILRFGYSLTGHKNSPASPEATGLEVDKLDANHVREYFTNYLDLYEKASNNLMGKKSFRYVVMDSWEAGAQNWTEHMPEEFLKDRGYNLKVWLPAIAGYVINDTEQTERFLWDYRKTISDMVARNHYDVASEILEKRGMARYSESHENGRAFTGDGMAVKQSAAVPMSAMWVDGQGSDGADIRESASVAHIYGQKFVAAESFTTGNNAWGFSPSDLKHVADMELASGLNKFIIHESAHQPLDDFKPGITLGPFGQWFNRHETWAEQALAWTTYLSRSCWMLSRGKNVADILFYYGEDTNITAQYGNVLPDLPEGYEFDFVNSNALEDAIKVKNGFLTAPSGNKWRVLVLGENVVSMSLPVAKSLEKLVKKGAIVIGHKPIYDPSLSDDQDEFQKVIDRIWGMNNVYTCSVAEAFEKLGMTPDLSSSAEKQLLFRHRDLSGEQIYWVNNRTQKDQDLDVIFRVDGLKPEIWDAATGKIKDASYLMKDGKTIVKMHMDADEALFIVFRTKTDVKENIIPEKRTTVISIDGPWKIAFNGMGAPSEVQMDSLQDLRENKNPYIRYYAGTMTYSRQLHLDIIPQNTTLWLDFGNLSNLAEVSINDHNLGVIWKYPFRVDATQALLKGNNEIEIRVTNLWVNRLIGDQRGDGGKYTHTTQTFYSADSPLRPSGLLGPVVLIEEAD